MGPAAYRQPHIQTDRCIWINSLQENKRKNQITVSSNKFQPKKNLTNGSQHISLHAFYEPEIIFDDEDDMQESKNTRTITATVRDRE